MSTAIRNNDYWAKSRLRKNGYAPIVHRCIVIANCYYRALTVAARAGMGIERRLPFVEVFSLYL